MKEQTFSNNQDPILASRLLSPLPLETFDAEAASLFEPLLSEFGLQWSIDTLSSLSITRDDAHITWLAMLPRICEELRPAGDAGYTFARWLATSHWDWIETTLRNAEDDQSPSAASARLNALVPPLLAILRNTVVVDAPDLLESIVRHLAATRTERRVNFLTALLRAAPKGKRHADIRLALLPLYELCTESLTAWLSAPPREPGDWSNRHGTRLPVRAMQNAPCLSDRAGEESPPLADREGAPRARPSDHRAKRAARLPSDTPHRPPLHAGAHQAGNVIRTRCGTKETVAGRCRMAQACVILSRHDSLPAAIASRLHVRGLPRDRARE